MSAMMRIDVLTRRDVTDFYSPDGEPLTLHEWSAMFEAMGTDRIVASTELNGVRVSTVWLGLDHNYNPFGGVPLFFETMIFGGELEFEQDCWRYPSKEAALAGHDQVVAMVRDAAVAP